MQNAQLSKNESEGSSLERTVEKYTMKPEAAILEEPEESEEGSSQTKSLYGQ